MGSHSVWEVPSEMRASIKLISVLVFVCSLGIFNANAAPMSDNFNNMKYGMIQSIPMESRFKYLENGVYDKSTKRRSLNLYLDPNLEYLSKMTVVKKNVEGPGSEIQKGWQSTLRSEGGGSEIQRGLQSALRSEGGGSEIQRGLQSAALRSEGGGSEILRALQSALGRDAHGTHHQCLYQPISCF